VNGDHTDLAVNFAVNGLSDDGMHLQREIKPLGIRCIWRVTSQVLFKTGMF
jgi:hypothetical protein